MTKFHIRPVKHVVKQGWVECQPHQAKAWEARVGARVLGRFTAKWQAEELLQANAKHKAKLPRGYVLGTPMGKRPIGLGQPIIIIKR